MIHALKRLVSAKVKQKKDVFHLAQRFTRFLNYHVTENLSCDKKSIMWRIFSSDRSCDKACDTACDKIIEKVISCMEFHYFTWHSWLNSKLIELFKCDFLFVTWRCHMNGVMWQWNDTLLPERRICHWRGSNLTIFNRKLNVCKVLSTLI